jgi:hypothetical protein
VSGKRERHIARKRILRALRPAWRRCWWTWPLGHEWPHWITTSASLPDRVSRCENCGKPYSLSSFSLYDLGRLYEKTTGEDIDTLLGEDA